MVTLIHLMHVVWGTLSLLYFLKVTNNSLSVHTSWRKRKTLHPSTVACVCKDCVPQPFSAIFFKAKMKINKISFIFSTHLGNKKCEGKGRKQSCIVGWFLNYIKLFLLKSMIQDIIYVSGQTNKENIFFVVTIYVVINSTVVSIHASR